MKRPEWIRPKEAAVLAGLALVLALCLVIPKGSGSDVVLTVGGEERGRYALNTPAQIPVQEVNGFSLTLVIQDGQAHVEGATCPDLICQHHAPVSRAGESIVCLPAQVTVTVEGGERHGPDSVAG